MRPREPLPATHPPEEGSMTASRSPSLAGGRGSACCARSADLPDLPGGTLGNAGEGASSWPPGGRSGVEVAPSPLVSGASPMPVTGEVERP
jgi:hypothetical protein